MKNKIINNNYKNKMIRDIIKENIRYLKISKEELAFRSNLSNKNINDFFLGKKDFQKSILSKLEKGLNLPKSSLINFHNELKKYVVRKKDKGIKEVVEFLEKQNDFELYSKDSLIKIASKFMGADKFKDREEEFLSRSKGFRKFKDKPLAYLWLSLLEIRYSHLKSQGKFKKSNGHIVIKKVLDIMINKEKFDVRIQNLKQYLDENGIIVVNAPFILDSTINGATYKKNKQRFIFMSDMKKREYQYIFCLVHELFHYYVNDFTENQDHKIANYISNYFKKYDKRHHGLKLAMQTYNKKDKDKWNLLYKETKNERIDFGDVKKLWTSISISN